MCRSLGGGIAAVTMVAALRASSVGGAAVPPIYAYAVTGNGSWEGVVSSDGRRFSLPNNTLLDGGSLAFAPDRAAVTYSLPPAHGRSRIRILVLGGRNRVVVTPGPQDAPPVYAADGRVLYASGRTISYVDGPSLAAHGLPTGAVIRYVAADPVNPVVFAATVVWGSVAAGTGEEALYRITPAGATVLAAGFAAASELAEPRFSPDGSKLAFIRSGRDRGGDLYVIDVDGRQLRRLTYSTHAGGPVWSPDGRRIAVTQRYGYRRHRSNGTPEVTVVDLTPGGSTGSRTRRGFLHRSRTPPSTATTSRRGRSPAPGRRTGTRSPLSPREPRWPSYRQPAARSSASTRSPRRASRPASARSPGLRVEAAQRRRSHARRRAQAVGPAPLSSRAARSRLRSASAQARSRMRRVA